MVQFKLSAFADEYSPVFDKQIEGLKKNGVPLIEIRGVDGTGIADITLEKAREVKAKLDEAGIGVSAIGSPLGKIKITDDMAPHLDSLRMPAGEDPQNYRGEVFHRLEQMLVIAEDAGIELCHENEKGIYGDTPERCADLFKYFGCRLKGVFDPANFLNVGAEPYPHAYELLHANMTYFHIKDADGLTIYPAGLGKGRIPEIIESIRKDFDGEMILTVEPHLTAFIGLDKLENTKGKIEKPYTDSEEAFGVAVSAIRSIIEK